MKNNKKTLAEQERFAFIKCVEKLLRTSQEYIAWATSIRMKAKNCKMCNLLNDETIIFHVHHSPTLYEVCDTNIKSIQDKSTLQTAIDILNLHMNKKVTTEVLCPNCHLKVHSLRR